MNTYEEAKHTCDDIHIMQPLHVRQD